MSRLVCSTLELERVLPLVARVTARALEVPFVSIWIADEPAGVLRRAFASDPQMWDGLAPVILRFGEGTVGAVAASRAPLEIPDVFADGRMLAPEWCRQRGFTSYLGLPIIFQGSLLGVLSLLAASPIAFGPEEAELLEAIADQAGVAIRNARLFAESEARRRTAEALAGVGRLLSETLDPELVAQRIADNLRVLLDVQDSAVCRLLPNGDLMAVAVSGDAEGPFAPFTVLPAGAGVAGLAVTERCPVATTNVLGDPRVTLSPELRARAQRGTHRGRIAVPLMIREQVTGTVVVSAEEGRQFSDAELTLMQAFAAQAALALENARLYRSQASQAKRLAALARLNRLVSSSLDMDEVLKAIAESAAKIMDVPFVSFWLVDGPDRLSLGASSDDAIAATLPSRTLRLEDPGLSCQVVREGRGFEVDDVLAKGRTTAPDWFRAHGFRSYYGIPIALQGAVLGVLGLNSRSPFRLRPEEHELIRSFADQAAIAIRNARLFAAEQAARAEAERRAVQQAAVADLGRRALAGTDLDTLLDHAVRAAAEILGTEYAKVLEQLPAGRGWRLRAGVGWAEGLVGRVTVGPGDSSLQRDHGVAGGASAAIGSGECEFGRLDVETKRPRTFTDDDRRFLQTLANVLAAAIERTRAQTRTQALAGVVHVMLRTLDPDLVARHIAESVCTLLDADTSGVFQLRPETGELEALAVRDSMDLPRLGGTLPAGSGLVGVAVEHRRPIHTDDMLVDPRITWTPEMRARAERRRLGPALAIPFMVNGHVIGALFVGVRRGRKLGHDQLTLAGAFADEAAIALENSRLYAEVRRNLAHTEALLRVSRAVAGTLDVTEALRRVARELAHALGADTVGAYLADPEVNLLRPRAGYRVPPAIRDALAEVAFPLRGQRFADEAWETGRSVWSADVARDPRLELKYPARFPCRSLLLVPLMHQGELIGALLAVWWERARSFPPDDVLLSEGIGRQAALALANVRLYNESEGRRREADTLADLARTINSSLDLNVILQQVTEAARALCGGDLARIALRDAEADTLSFRYWSGHASTQWGRVSVRPGIGIGGRVLTTGLAFRTDDCRADVRITQDFAGVVRREGITVVAAVPITMDGRVEGILFIDRRGGPGFTDHHQRILDQLAHHAAVAIKNAGLFAGAERARAEAEAAAGRLRALSERLVQVQEEERRALARELHDEIGQALTALKINLEVVRRVLGLGGVAARIDDSIAIANQLLDQVRAIALDLRPAMLDDLGLQAAVEWYIDRQARRAGFRARMSIDLGRRYPSEIETACFRLVQEAVTNAVRHGGAATIDVEVRQSDDALELLVRDDGSGFDVVAARQKATLGDSTGLLGMEERVRLLGGRFAIDSTPGQGTRLSARLPLTASGS